MSLKALGAVEVSATVVILLTSWQLLLPFPVRSSLRHHGRSGLQEEKGEFPVKLVPRDPVGAPPGQPHPFVFVRLYCLDPGR